MWGHGFNCNCKDCLSHLCFQLCRSGLDNLIFHTFGIIGGMGKCNEMMHLTSNIKVQRLLANPKLCTFLAKNEYFCLGWLGNTARCPGNRPWHPIATVPYHQKTCHTDILIWIWTELLDPTTLCCAPSYWSSILPKYLNGPSNVGQHPLWNFHSTSLLFDMISTVKEGIEKTFTQPEQGVIKSNENYCLRRYLLWIWLEFLNDTET